MWAWGANASGQLGYGPTPPVAGAQENGPVQVQGLAGRTIVAVAAGSLHSVALDSEGGVWAWGANASYQVGDGTAITRTRPVLVDGLWGVTKIGSGAGSNHTLAVRGGDGAVFAWGSNGAGTLGDGTQTVRTTPVKVVGLTNVVAVATSGLISTAVEADGTLWSWGYSGHVGDGGTDAPPLVHRLLPVELAPTGIVAVSPGSRALLAHALALGGDGVVWAWGYGAAGQNGDGHGAVSGWPYRHSPVRVTEPGFQRKVATPYATGPQPGLHYNPVTVAFATIAAGAAIHYTTDGSEPTTGSTSFTAPFQVTQSTTFKVKAFKSGLADSNSQTLAYTIQAATPVFTPPAGTYTAAQNVAMTTTSPGAVIRYTTNNTEPNGDSTQYTTPLAIGAATIVRAATFHGSMATSATAVAIYAFNFPAGGAPAFDPAPGTFIGSAAVTMTAAPGATIRYTVDGSDPVATSTTYTAPVAVAATTTLKAKSFQPAQLPSPTTTGVYTIQLALPTLSPVGGSVPVGQLVTLGHADPAVTLRYTIDGTDPVGDGSADAVVAPGATVTINSGLTLKVLAAKAGCTSSAISTGVYTVTGVGASPGVIGAGIDFSLLARPDGSVWGWGSNYDGALGSGGVAGPRLSPTVVSELSGITFVDGGWNHGAARKDDGTVWTAGANASGQLGIGVAIPGQGTYAALTHAALVNPHTVVMMTAGQRHTLALRGDGTVWSWGENGYGQLGNGNTNQQSSPVQVGGGTPLTGVQAITTMGGEFSVALKTDGTVWAWGRNADGELGNNATGSSSLPVQVQTQSGAALTGVVEIAAGRFHALARRTDGTVWAWGWNGSGELGSGATSGAPALRRTGHAARAGEGDHGGAIPQLGAAAGRHGLDLGPERRRRARQRPLGHPGCAQAGGRCRRHPFGRRRQRLLAGPGDGRQRLVVGLQRERPAGGWDDDLAGDAAEGRRGGRLARRAADV